MRQAFKERAVVVDALGRVERCLLLRKGGIHEPTGGFRPVHRRFWLFPTAYHQQKVFIQSGARIRFDEQQRGFRENSTVCLQFLAEQVQAAEIPSVESALSLREHPIWTDETIRRRFASGDRQSIYALSLRVHRMPRPFRLPDNPHYADCRSWIELEVDPPESGLEPILTDREFATRHEAIEICLTAGT